MLKPAAAVGGREASCGMQTLHRVRREHIRHVGSVGRRHRMGSGYMRSVEASDGAVAGIQTGPIVQTSVL